MSSRRRAGLPAPTLRRALLVGAAASASVLAAPALAAAAPNPAEIKLVVTKTVPAQAQQNEVVTLRLQNTGAETWQPDSPAGDDRTVVTYFNDDDGTSNSAPRSYYGWRCVGQGGGQTCLLNHPIAAGAYSLPIEFEVLPNSEDRDFAAYRVFGGVDAPNPAPAGRAGLDEDAEFSVVGDDPGQPGRVSLSWSEDGVTDYNRAPKATAAASNTDLVDGEAATVGFELAAAGPISTGPFTSLPQKSSMPRAFDGHGFELFPAPSIELNLPSDKVQLISLKAFAPKPEQDDSFMSSTTRDSRILADEAKLDEVVVPAELITPAEGGRYVVNVAELAPLLRLLPDNPVRFVAKVKLADGVNLATLVVNVLTPGEAIAVDEATRAAGRAAVAFAGPYSATASVTLRRAVAPTPTPTPTPTPAATATPTPTPVPEQSAVLAARAAPKLTGKARFKAHSIRVGKKTTLSVDVTNSGNAASTDGDVCVRISRQLVILSVPKGVTVKGSVLCAKRTAIDPSKTLTAASGIVVRGVQATPVATARDGANDGVDVSGDRLRVLQRAVSHAGGVTG